MPVGAGTAALSSFFIKNQVAAFGTFKQYLDIQLLGIFFVLTPEWTPTEACRISKEFPGPQV
jgi:hypothetical protein